MGKSKETWKPIRFIIVLGLLAAGVLAVIPGYQERALQVLMVTPLAVSTVSGILLLKRGTIGAAMSFLLSVLFVLGIAFYEHNGQ